MPWLPSVSVVVPVYNGAETIEACVGSLCELDYPGPCPELIVVDNGSRDGTRAILERHRARINVVHEAKRGASAARNAGIHLSSGEVIAFTDADCVVDPNWLRHLVRPLEDPCVGIAGGTNLAAEPRTIVTLFGEQIHDQRLAIQEYKPGYVATVNWASRRETLVRVGGFDDAFRRGQDVDLAYRIQQAGFRLVFVPEAIIYHRNVRTLRGLFQEGYLHGLYGVLTAKTHEAFVAKYGHRRFDTHRLRQLAVSCSRALRQRPVSTDTCDCVFRLGKQVGRIAAAFKFRYVEL